MNQRHKYDYKVSPSSAAAKVVRMVGKNQRVLELGSGPGAITRLLNENSCRVTALELDQNAIDIVSKYCEKIYRCNLNDSEWPNILSSLDRFNVIVAGDVLEHLYNPWDVLTKLHGLLSTDGHIVISLPHIGHNAIIACLLSGDFEYQPWGLLDQTHIRFFGLKNVQELFNNAGFKIIQAEFVVKSPEQTEFASRWRMLSPEAQALLSNNKFGSIYQIVVKAVPLAAPGKPLQLASLPVPLPDDNSFSVGSRGSRILGFFISFLSLRTRQRICRLLERIGCRI